MKKDDLDEHLIDMSCKQAWKALKEVINNVLGKNRAEPEEVKRLVKDMLFWYAKIESSMTLKLHFLHQHLDDFLKQLPTESDEQGERFHQITMPMEKRFKGKKVDALLSEVCWWSHKKALHSHQVTESIQGDDTEPGGNTEAELPMVVQYEDTDESDIESDDDAGPSAKKQKND